LINFNENLKHFNATNVGQLHIWHNSSFSPLTFPKLRFCPLRKKLQNRPLSFATVAVLAPQGCHVSVDRVKIGLVGQNCHGAKLRGQFCSFFSS